MFGFIKNLDTMKRATTKKKPLKDLDDVSRVHKEEMDQMFGGGIKGKKKGKSFWSNWFSPCEGDIPQ